jgi:hypothetical protein
MKTLAAIAHGLSTISCRARSMKQRRRVDQRSDQ